MNINNFFAITKKIKWLMIFIIAMTFVVDITIANASQTIKFVSKYEANLTVEVSNADEFINEIKKNKDANIILTKDISFLNHATNNSAVITETFTGTINGNNYAIKNLNSALFNKLESATITNLILDDNNIKNNGVRGLLANESISSFFDSIYIINSKIHAENGNGLGGFIGHATNVTVNNVSVENVYVDGSQFVGGFFSQTTGNVTINNLFLKVGVTGEGWSVGGFVGRNNNGNIVINNSIIAPDMTTSSGTTRKAGFIGNVNGTVSLTFNNTLLAANSSNNSGIPRVLGAGSATGVNVYDWTGSSLKEQNYNWLTKISTDNINKEFFEKKILLDNEIWNLNNATIVSLPNLSKAIIKIDEYNKRVPKTPSFLKTLEELDEQIKNNYTLEFTQEYKLLLMQRELINKVGYDWLIDFVAMDSDNAEFLNWLMSSYKNMEAYIIGGSPDGNNYKKEILILNSLYENYKSDLSNNTITKDGNVLGDVYHTMMFSIAKGYSITVRFWTAWSNDEVGNINSYDHPSVSHPLERYELFKKLHKNNLLGYQNKNGTFIRSNKMFESLEIEEMRYVTNAHLSDEGLEWLNWYMDSEEAKKNEPKWSNNINSRRNPYTYMEYTFGFQYNRSFYGDDANFVELDKKFGLSQFGITDLKSGAPLPFVVFEEGGICWGISKVGADIWNALGVPANAVSQPGHLAYIYSSYDDVNDKLYWGGISNAIGSWGTTGEGGPTAMNDKFHVRMPLTWGDDWSVTGWNASYVALSQENLNNIDKYTSSQLMLLLANSYNEDINKKEEIYKQAIKLNSRDYEAWLNLVKLYVNDSSKTTEDYLDLLEDISDELDYAPLPMYDLFRLIYPKIKDENFSLMNYNMLLEQNLKRDALVNYSNLENEAVVRTARHLLGQVDTEVATFSFDGDNANTIKLSESKFGSNFVVWDYSLDKGKSWTQVEGTSIKLSKEEISKITSEDDILVHIIGVSYEPDNLFAIDIIDGVAPNGLYVNDLENRIVGAYVPLEYLNSLNEWSKYEGQTSRFFGNAEVTIRTAATKTTKASSSVTYKFTEDNQPDNRKYYSVLGVKAIEGGSPYNNDKKLTNIIDGHNKTNYYTSSGNNYMVFKLDEILNLSAIEVLPYGAYVGRPLEITVFGSMDGKEYNQIKKVTGLSHDASLKVIDFDEAVELQYVKIVVDKTTDGSFTGTMVNFYHDVTIDTIDTSLLEASIKEANNVLKNPDYIKSEEALEMFNEIIKEANDLILNPSKVQSNIIEMKIKLDRAISEYVNSENVKIEKPEGAITYSTKELTNKNVIATLNIDSDVIVTNNNGLKTFVFTKNGTFTFEFERRGVKGTAIAVVSNIDKEAPTVKIEYLLSADKKTKIARIIDENETIIVINNEGKKEYLFTENGTFTFEIKDLVGNISFVTATVNDLKEESEEDKVNPDGNKEDPEEDKVNPDGNKEDPEEDKVNPDGNKEDPEEDKIDPDGNKEDPEDDKVNPDGNKEDPEEDKVNPEEDKINKFELSFWTIVKSLIFVGFIIIIIKFFIRKRKK